MAWAVPISEPEMIVPFLLSDIEEVVGSSQDTATGNKQISGSSSGEMPMLAQLLQPDCISQPAPVQVCRPAIQNIVSSPFPKVAQTVKLNSVTNTGEYKLVFVPDDQNVIALQSQAPQQWYVSAASTSQSSVSTTSTANVVSPSQSLYRVAPQNEGMKPVKVVHSMSAPTKTVTIFQPNLQMSGQLMSKNAPVVVVGNDGECPSAVVQQPGTNSGTHHPGPPPMGNVSLQSSVSSLSGECLVAQQAEDVSMPIITSVMSLSNVDFNSIDDNARMVVKNRHVVAPLDSHKQEDTSLQNTLILKKASSGNATTGSQSLLISKPTNQAGNLAEKFTSVSVSGSVPKAVPRIISKPGCATQQSTGPVRYILKRQNLPNIQSKSLLSPVPVSKACERSVTVIGNRATAVNTSKTIRTPITAGSSSQADKSIKSEVFELDTVKKVGNTIMGSTITFKPSVEQTSMKESENEKTMIQKLQQAISCFEESALKSNNTFNKEERNMLESVLSKLKGDAAQMKVKTELPPAAPQKTAEAKVTKSVPDEKQCTDRNNTSCKKPMRRIVITSDTVPSAPAHVIKEGIESFLLKNKISNDFTEDEILNLHWDGKDIDTLHHKQEQQIPLPTIVPSSDRKGECLVQKQDAASPQPTPLQPSPDGAMKLEFKPRVIRVIKKNGEVVERTLGDHCPSLPVLTNQLYTKALSLQSPSNPPVSQTAQVPQPQASNNTRVVKVLPPPTQPKEQVSLPKQTTVTNQPLQTLMNSVMDKTSTEQQKQYVTALFPDGQLRRIAISAVQVRKEPSKKSAGQNRNLQPKVTTGEKQKEQKVTETAKSTEGSSSRSKQLPSGECDIASILEPEVVLEESNIALNYSASESSVPSPESDSSFNCNTESEDSDEEEDAPEWTPGRRPSGRQAPPPQKQSPQQKRKRRPPDPYRKRRRSSARRNRKKARVDNTTSSADPQIEPIAARLRYANARATVVVNCTNCISSPCIVVMDRLNDEIVKTGRVNLEDYKEPELFALSATPNVTLNSSTVVEAVKLEKSKTNESIAKAEGEEATDVMQMLLDSQKTLDELRKRYQ